MRTAVPILMLLAATVALAGGDLDERLDSLLERWRGGDEAARAGVVAETLALGEPAIAGLLDRIAPQVADFPGAAPGVTLSAPEAVPSGRLVSLEFRLARCSGGGPGQVSPRLVPPDHVEALASGCEHLSAPRLTVHDGQRANVSILDRTSYVRTRDADGGPVEGLVSSGLVVDARARTSPDGRTVSVEMRCVQADLTRPIGRLETARGAIEVPVLSNHEFGVTLEIGSGNEAVLLLPAGDAALLLHVRATALEGLDLPEHD